jgi:outer membrane protein OmpA-like peptidoglycan-associated protein
MRRITVLLLILVMLVFQVDGRAEEEMLVTGPENTAKLTFRTIDESKILVSVLDAAENPILGLLPKDFSIKKGPKTAKILSVEPLEASKQIGLNVVLVVDNSLSMKHRKAIQPLLSAVEEFFFNVRPIDNIHAVVFDQKNTITIEGRQLNAHTFQSNNVDELRAFFKKSFDENLTTGTYLYDGIIVGLDIIRRMPAKENKFLLVFTDGNDLNSSFSTEDVAETARDIPNFFSYALDFTKESTLDPFLESFSQSHGGKIWKATSSAELSPIFEAFSSTLLHRYIITYRYLAPPQGTLALEPKTIIIEEVTTIDSSPLLNYIFFEQGNSDIPEFYHLFPNQSDTDTFSEAALKGTMEKYHNLLNIIGKRLNEHSDARITIIGCNSNQGPEKGNLTLSNSRAAAVRAYLRYIWGIDPSRMEIKARHLPAAASSSYVPEGVAENQRVEIHSDHPNILDTIKSTYVQEVSATKAIQIRPDIEAEAGISTWKLYLKAGPQELLGSKSGEMILDSLVAFDLETIGLKRIAAFNAITAGIEVMDKEDNLLKMESAASASVKFIRRNEQKTQKTGHQVLEKHALILFDFNSADIKERNKMIMDRIIQRVTTHPSAKINIVGHTDNIGKEAYNINLSERRAEAVFDQMIATGMIPLENISYSGLGPNNPLYDNLTPEGRSLNRTVTVTLAYEEK